MIRALALTLLLFCSTALAQRAVIIELPTGQLVGVAYTPTGAVMLTDITIIKVPPPGPVVPPTPTTKGPVWTIIIRTVDTMTADQSLILSDVRQWTDQQPATSVKHREFSPTAVGPNGERDAKVATWVAKIPPTAKQPYVFIAQSTQDGKTAIHWQSELTSADDIIAKIRQYMPVAEGAK